MVHFTFKKDCMTCCKIFTNVVYLFLYRAKHLVPIFFLYRRVLFEGSFEEIQTFLKHVYPSKAPCVTLSFPFKCLFYFRKKGKMQNSPNMLWPINMEYDIESDCPLDTIVYNVSDTDNVFHPDYSLDSGETLEPQRYKSDNCSKKTSRENNIVSEMIFYFGSLYSVLSKILRKKEVAMTRIFCDFRDFISDSFVDKRSVIVSSICEGIYEPEDCIDVIFVLKWIDMAFESPKTVLSGTGCHLIVDTNTAYPGYVYLKVHSGLEFDLISKCVKMKRSKSYLSSHLFKLNLSVEAHTCIPNSLEESECTLSLTYALGPCQANELLESFPRKNNGWLSEDLVFTIKKCVLLVPNGYPGSPDSEILWQLTFVLASKVIVRSFSHVQLLTYLLLKIYIRQKLAKDFSTTNVVSLSYVIKTVMFWVMEESTESWARSNFLANLISCFNKLVNCITSGNMPDFFIPEVNIIEKNEKILALKSEIQEWKPTETDLWDTVVKQYCHHLDYKTWVAKSRIYADLQMFTLFPFIQVECTSVEFKSFLQRAVLKIVSNAYKPFLQSLFCYQLLQQCQIISQLVQPQKYVSNKKSYMTIRSMNFLSIMGTKTDSVSGWILLGFRLLQSGQHRFCSIVLQHIESLINETFLVDTGIQEYSVEYLRMYKTLLRTERRLLITKIRHLSKQPVLVPEESVLIPIEGINGRQSDFCHIPSDIMMYYLKFSYMSQTGNMTSCPEILIQAKDAVKASSITEDMKMSCENLFVMMESILHEFFKIQ